MVNILALNPGCMGTHWSNRFFNAFGPILQPNVCVLLDVGTQPGPSSIYRCVDHQPIMAGTHHGDTDCGKHLMSIRMSLVLAGQLDSLAMSDAKLICVSCQQRNRSFEGEILQQFDQSIGK